MHLFAFFSATLIKTRSTWARDGLLFHHEAPCKDYKYAGLGRGICKAGISQICQCSIFVWIIFPDNLFKIKTVSWCCGQVYFTNDVKQRIEFKTMINTHTTKQELTNNSFHNTREHSKLISICIIKRNITVYQRTAVYHCNSVGLTVLAHITLHINKT